MALPKGAHCTQWRVVVFVCEREVESLVAGGKDSLHLRLECFETRFGFSHLCLQTLV